MTCLTAEPRNSLVNDIASDAQELAWQEPGDISCSRCKLEAAFSKPGLWVKLQEKCVPVQLVYDSYTQPVASGMRSLAMHVRQMLFRSDPYQIDIQLEAQPDRNRLIVTGQLIDVGREEMLEAGIEVTLSDGQGHTISTVTNQFGEFRGEVNLSGDLDLSFLRRDGKPVVILVRGTLDPTSRGRN